QKPGAREITACLPWLEKEIEILEPEVLDCLGATAAQALLGRTFKVTERHGEVLASPWSKQTVATVHPSSILRQRTEEDRRRSMQSFTGDLRVAAALLDGRR